MGADAHGDPNLAHHFEDMDQQLNAAKLGMWLFLATEVLLFAGLFCAYAVYRASHPEVFEYASRALSMGWGAFNTVVLLLSSFTVALAVRAAGLGQRKQTSIFLVLTLLGAAIFMGVKAIEYNSKFEHHTVWGLGYVPQTEQETEFAERGEHPEEDHAEEGAGEHAAEGDDGAAEPEPVDPRVAALLETEVDAASPWEGSAALQERSLIAPPAEAPEGRLIGDEPVPATPEQIRNAHIFFGIYFIMTGTHGLHVVIGALAICWVLWRNQRGDFSPHYNTPVDLVGLYWHLVDLIWIFLFPLLYLINVQDGPLHG